MTTAIAPENTLKKWLGVRVKVIDPQHPHFRATGIVESFDHLKGIGQMGIKIKGENSSFYVFNIDQLKKILYPLPDEKSTGTVSKKISPTV